MASYKNKVKKLLKLGYIVKQEQVQQEGAYVELDRNYYLTDKGRFAKHLYSNEVVLTELFHLKFLDQFSELDLLTLLAAIVYEERRLDYFMIKGSEKTYKRIMSRIHGTHVFTGINKIHLKRMINFVKAWATGAKFSELMKFSNLQEGDIIRFFRRLIDTITQLQHATEDEELRDKLGALIRRIDRDFVAEI